MLHLLSPPQPSSREKRSLEHACHSFAIGANTRSVERLWSKGDNRGCMIGLMSPTAWVAQEGDWPTPRGAEGPCKEWKPTPEQTKSVAGPLSASLVFSNGGVCLRIDSSGIGHYDASPKVSRCCPDCSFVHYCAGARIFSLPRLFHLLSALIIAGRRPQRDSPWWYEISLSLQLTYHKPLANLTLGFAAILSRSDVTAYVRAILDPNDKSLPKLECPRPDLSRYEHLKPPPDHGSPLQTRYFFALNLRNNLSILPRLLGSIVEAIQFLGPEHCALSIVEGNSPDGTADVLAALQPQLHVMNRQQQLRTHFTLHNIIDPLAEGHDRFTSLAELRNLVLQPMLREPDRYSDTTVLFINDVAICLEDILELAHQRRIQGADMACAFDWIGGGSGPDDLPAFYDVYVARSINGDLFFEVPPDISWKRAQDMFWNEPTSRARWHAHLPFQVFTCWDGAVAFTATPIVKGGLQFRAARRDLGECHAGEPELFCKDMWWKGHGKIMVVPTVHLEYSNEKGKYIKELKGYVSDWVGKVSDKDMIEWRGPPEQVKCMPTFNEQSWRLWNETLF